MFQARLKLTPAGDMNAFSKEAGEEGGGLAIYGAASTKEGSLKDCRGITLEKLG